jgi:hypothetical protein
MASKVSTISNGLIVPLLLTTYTKQLIENETLKIE